MSKLAVYFYKRSECLSLTFNL